MAITGEEREATWCSHSEEHRAKWWPCGRCTERWSDEGCKAFACEAQYESILKYLEEHLLVDPEALLTKVGILNVNFCESRHHTMALYRPKNVKATARECFMQEEFALARINTVVLQDNEINFSWLESLEHILTAKLG